MKLASIRSKEIIKEEKKISKKKTNALETGRRVREEMRFAKKQVSELVTQTLE